MATDATLYDPLTDPLELPVQALTLTCRAERPLLFGRHGGATPGTTLWGAFGDALLDTACVRGLNGAPGCGDAAGECLAPDHCPGRWLYKPRAEDRHPALPKPVSRHLARPVLLSAPDLETGRPVADFRLDAVLWGRQAIARRAVVEDALRRMAARGLQPAGEAGPTVPFRIEDLRAEPPATLAERLAASPEVPPPGLRLVFETPFMLEKNDRKAGPEQLSLADLLGGCAYDLAVWDLADREAGPDLPKPRHKLGLDARDAARRAAEALRPVGGELATVDVGFRVSRHNGHGFPLRGFVGYADFLGDAGAARPWLLALALVGGGEKRPWGFGRVRVEWLDGAGGQAPG
jgi:hypothetical protein